jgi:hypothetical protein
MRKQCRASSIRLQGDERARPLFACVSALQKAIAKSKVHMEKLSAVLGAAMAPFVLHVACVSADTATTPASPAQVIIDASKKIAPISGRQIGTNMAGFFDITQGGSLSAMKATGTRFIRWPGGSNSDAYHWQNNSFCNGMYMNPNSTFENFMNLIAIPGNYEVAITVNYGSNSSCNGGGDPNEAAAWVKYIKDRNYNIHYWTVGNEVFGGWEYDLHNPAHDPNTYVAAMLGSNGYYQKMKTQDPTAQIGVVAEGAGWNNWDGWDKTVLSNAPYDFVEIHWYAQQPFQESDSYLLNQAPVDLRNVIGATRSELTQAGRPANTPILIGEFNSVAYNQGKQTTSIVNALFAGMAFGEVLNNNVQMATWWFGYGGGCNGGGNNSSSLYGWQNFGAYDQVASNWSCNGGYVPDGVVMPNGRALNLVSQFAVPGNNMLSASIVDSSVSNVRVYGATQGSGYSVMLFNLDPAATKNVTVGVSNAAGSSYSVSSATYGKQQYDDSRNGVWTGPVSKSLGTVGTSVAVSLPPWSMTVLKLQASGQGTGGSAPTSAGGDGGSGGTASGGSADSSSGGTTVNPDSAGSPAGAGGGGGSAGSLFIAVMALGVAARRARRRRAL